MLTSISKFTHNSINEIFSYAENISSKYASRLIQNIYCYIDTLKIFPYIGRKVLELSNKEYRERIYANYRIVYQPFEKTKYVYINFIVHAKRDFLRYYNLYLEER